jgi:3-oxoacyl-[acyl-carrier protein] reductase
MINLNLQGKTAMIGGGSQGIGRAAAIELAQMGANVILLARNPEKLREVIQELDTSKGQVHNYIKVDYSNPPMMLAEVENFLFHYSNPIHILVNNTGGPQPGPAMDAHPESFTKAFNQHLVCNHVLMQALLPGMKKEGFGRIINVISTSVKAPLHNLGVSNTIRAAVANWAKTLSVELAPFGITVNNVLPGATHTGRLQSIIQNKAEKTETKTDDIERDMLKEIPAGRFGAPEEVAYAIAFLASDSASYINGINIPVDGGRTPNL